MVPRSRSRVIESEVIKSVDMLSTMHIKPGTTLSTVSCSGL